MKKQILILSLLAAVIILVSSCNVTTDQIKYWSDQWEQYLQVPKVKQQVSPLPVPTVTPTILDFPIYDCEGTAEEPCL